MELTTYTELEIAHRLLSSYARKCRSCHGHRYEVEITVTAQKFNEDGMIVDFKKLKEVVKTVLDDKWDHGSCFNAGDPLAKAVQASGSERVHIISANPTLEWMVEYWVRELQEALSRECPGVAVSMLKASETAKNTVTWRCKCLPWEKSERAVDAKKPTCAEKDTSASPVEEEDNPDAVPYLVTYTNGNTIGSKVIYSSAKAQALYDYCTQQVQQPDSLFVMIVSSISRLPA